MSKILKITVILMMVLLCTLSVVQAATTSELIASVSKTYKIAGKEVKLSESDLVKVKRYLTEYPVSAENADKIITKIDEAVDLMNKEGVSNPAKLSKAKKDELLKIAQEAATLAGATLTYDSSNKSILVYKDGKQYDSLSLSSYKFANTGSNNTTIYIITAGVAIIAVATVIGYRKFKANV